MARLLSLANPRAEKEQENRGSVLAEAIAVKTQAGGLRSAAEPSAEPRLDELWDAFGIDGPAMTVTIGKRECLVVAPAG
jgi:hypothetical protein